VLKNEEVFQTELIGYSEDGWNGPLGDIVSSGNVDIGFDFFRGEIQSFVGLLDDVRSFFVGPEVPGEGFELTVVSGVSRESGHY